jgi:hypothetical protein
MGAQIPIQKEQGMCQKPNFINFSGIELSGILYKLLKLN